MLIQGLMIATPSGAKKPRLGAAGKGTWSGAYSMLYFISTSAPTEHSNGKEIIDRCIWQVLY